MPEKSEVMDCSRWRETLREPDLLCADAFVNGKWEGSDDRFSVFDPATGSLLAQVSNTSPELAFAAIDHARKSFSAWANTPAKERSIVLRRWFDLIMAAQDDLATIITVEQGKPMVEARTEVSYGASFVEWYAEEAKRIHGELLPQFTRGRRLSVMRQAVGVCVAITPWNFPLAMITRKVAPALAAGCAVIVKPAELARRAGVPAGVLAILPADADRSVELGKIFCASPSVRHLSFTGSTPVGKLLLSQCASTVKKVALELGGNAPFIVFDDADLEQAVDGAIASKYRNSGQTCVCANRFYVQAGIYEQFVARLTEKVGALVPGHGLDPRSSQGPLIDLAAVAKVEQHLEDAVQKGGRVTIGGARLEGSFFQPTVVADAEDSMLFASDETFGPVAPVFRFSTEAEALEAANRTHYGLAAYVYTKDSGRMTRVSEQLEFGVVGVNASLVSTEHVPFGGVKESGLGREGAKQGIEEYLDIKYVCVGGIDEDSNSQKRN